jgi:hypothetical protein
MSSNSTLSSDRPRVYLSGGMEYAAGEGRDWRSMMQEWLEQELHCTVFNPNRESDRFFRERHAGIDFRAMKAIDMERYRAIAAELVAIDCREIAERTDIVVCYWDASAMRGAGTKGELTMARYCAKPVFLVTDIPAIDIPGWVLGCITRMFPDFDALKDFLKTQLPPLSSRDNER